MQGMKFDYLPWSPVVSLQPHVIASVARLQRQEVSWRKEEDGDLVGFVHESTGGLHPLASLQTILILQLSSENLLEVLLLLKYMANLITFYFQIDTMALLLIHSGNSSHTAIGE
jgi:hypothetical protein